MFAIICSIILIVLALALVILVLMQHGKEHNLSGTIAGGAETFFGKTKGQAVDKRIQRLTTVLAVVFVAFVLITYVSLNGGSSDGKVNINDDSSSSTSESVSDSESASESASESSSESEASSDEAAPSDSSEA